MSAPRASAVAVRPLPTPRLPGVHASLAITLTVVLALVVVPLLALVVVVSRAEPAHVSEVLFSDRTLAAYGLSFGAAMLAALLSVPIGLGVAWTLVRYDVPGRRLWDALVDLPFAMPTAVSGIALTQLWGPRGAFGALLAPLGLEVAFTRAGVVLALVFVSLPFVVRTVQPVIESFPRETEEAAASLGADRLTTFRRVILPALRPALLAGATLGFARAIGEYGSVVFIAGNVPFRTEIAPLLVLVRLEEYDYAGAAAIATGMLTASAAILVILSQRGKGLRHG
jgi:sulfate transport system permease protein